MTSKVGIIPNPHSGKDIRRLVAHASTFSNMEKVNIVLRAILGAQAFGTEEVLIMPDAFGIGIRAIENLRAEKKPSAGISILDMNYQGTEADSTEAARLMGEEGVGCIIVVGGDGTNRAVSKGCTEVPLIGLSTGTNNVIPVMMESTTAGIAAALVASGQIKGGEAGIRSKILEISVNGRREDMALVDLALSKDIFIGSRAIWDMLRIEQIIATRGEPGDIGMASIVSALHPLSPSDDAGMQVKLGRKGTRVRAIIAPGLVEYVNIEEHRLLKLGDSISIRGKKCTLALDGERSVQVGEGDDVGVTLTRCGPLFVDAKRTLALAAQRGLF